MTTIAEIDTRLDAIYRDMRRRETIAWGSAVDWQRAWNRNPDLRAEERNLLMRRDQLRRPLAYLTKGTRAS